MICLIYTAGKIRFSGALKSVLLKASSGDCCAPRSFVLLMTLLNIEMNIKINSGAAAFSAFFLSDSIITT